MKIAMNPISSDLCQVILVTSKINYKMNRTRESKIGSLLVWFNRFNNPLIHITLAFKCLNFLYPHAYVLFV